MNGIDKGQELMGKGVEVAGRLIGSETIEKFGTGIVEQQRADIKAGNYQPQFPGSLRENYEQGNFFSALGEKLLENLPQMGFALPPQQHRPCSLFWRTGMGCYRWHRHYTDRFRPHGCG